MKEQRDPSCLYSLRYNSHSCLCVRTGAANKAVKMLPFRQNHREIRRGHSTKSTNVIPEKVLYLRAASLTSSPVWFLSCSTSRRKFLHSGALPPNYAENVGISSVSQIQEGNIPDGHYILRTSPPKQSRGQ